jgi:hypothetical protein
MELPRGVGEVPSWWLELVPHTICEDVLIKKRRLRRRSVGEAVEKINEETNSIVAQKSDDNHNDLTSIESERHSNYEKRESPMERTKWSNRLEFEGKEIEYHETVKSFPKERISNFNVVMSSHEEETIVESRRSKGITPEEYGQTKLRARPGNVKTTEDDDRDTFINNALYQPIECIKEEIGDQETYSLTSAPATTSVTNHKKPVIPSSNKFHTAFTGVSPFDFAMQQSAKEKERREKERLSREALSKHHGALLLADKAAEYKAKDEEIKRKKKEAEELLKMFKAPDLDKQFELASEMKKLQIEEKQKKKEADELLKGYRER